MKRIYLDNAATTRVRRDVLEVMKPYFSDKYGNASSLHSFGREASEALQKARQIIAKTINADEEEIIFTSSGSEADNLAIKGLALANKDKKHVITSKIEHPAVLETCKVLEKEGYKVDYLNVDNEGFISLEELKKLITKKTLLVTIMHANNEIGTIQPIKEIGEICKQNDVYFHTDAVQSYGKINVDVKQINVDLISLSAHKIYGPKGVGALYVKKATRIEPLIHGGGHEFGLRASTENIAGIVGFSKAAELMHNEMNKEMKKQEKLRDYLIKEVLKIKDSRLNGPVKNRLPNNTNFSFRAIEGESLLLRLDALGIAASTGSACSSKKLEPSHVLLAIGLKHEEAHGSLRVSIGRETTKKDIDYLLANLPKIVNELREISAIK